MRRGGNWVFAVSVAGVLAAIIPTLRASGSATFEQAVSPVLENTCTLCHNQQSASGGFDASAFLDPGSLAGKREGWERILEKLRAGEMPPKGIPRSQAQIDALVKYVQGEFAKADRNTKPDPGRVTVHRLNRNEYANTIRDLLSVEFRAQKDFPTDDSGEGFDNIGDILTISPVLMEKYLAAAERIASRAVAADPLPKPFSVEYAAKDKRIRRVDSSSVEASHRIDFDGEYTVRFGLPGERPADAKPVKLGFWMDGKLIGSKMVETKPSGLVFFDPYSEEEMRLPLPEGDHVFRAGFIGDDFVKGLAPRDLYNRKTQQIHRRHRVRGSFQTEGPRRPAAPGSLICDPNSGPACVEKIVGNLARHAYRRPVSKAEVASLVKIRRHR